MFPLYIQLIDSKCLFLYQNVSIEFFHNNNFPRRKCIAEIHHDICSDNESYLLIGRDKLVVEMIRENELY